MHVAPRRLFENVIVVQYIGLVGVTLLTLFGFQAAFGNVLTRANLEVLAMNMVFEGIMALGMTFVIIMGGIDLSVASVFAFSEILVAKLMVQAGFAIVPGHSCHACRSRRDRGAERRPHRPVSRSSSHHHDGNSSHPERRQSRDHRRSFRFRVLGRVSLPRPGQDSRDQRPHPFLRRRRARPRRPARPSAGSFASSISSAAANAPRVCPASTSAGSRSSSICSRRFSPDAPESWPRPNMARRIGRTEISLNSKPSLRSPSAAPTSTAAAEQSEGLSSGSSSWPSSTTRSSPRR